MKEGRGSTEEEIKCPTWSEATLGLVEASNTQPPSHDHCDYKDELNELLSCLEDRHSTDEPEHASHSFLHQNTAAPSHPSSSYFSRDSTGAFSEHQHTGNKPFAEEVGDKNRAEGQGDLDLASAMQLVESLLSLDSLTHQGVSQSPPSHLAHSSADPSFSANTAVTSKAAQHSSCPCLPSITAYNSNTSIGALLSQQDLSNVPSTNSTPHPATYTQPGVTPAASSPLLPARPTTVDPFLTPSSAEPLPTSTPLHISTSTAVPSYPPYPVPLPGATSEMVSDKSCAPNIPAYANCNQMFCPSEAPPFLCSIEGGNGVWDEQHQQQQHHQQQQQQQVMAAAMAASMAAAPQFFPPMGGGGCSMPCDGMEDRASRPACQKGTKEGKRWGHKNLHKDQAVVDQLLAQRMHGREGSLPLPPDPSPPFSEMAAFPPSCWGGMETGYWIPGINNSPFTCNSLQSSMPGRPLSSAASTPTPSATSLKRFSLSSCQSFEDLVRGSDKLSLQGKRSRKNSYSNLTCYRESHSGSEGDGDGEESPRNSPQMSKADTKKKGGGRTKKGSAKAVVGRKTSTATQPAPKSQPTTRREPQPEGILPGILSFAKTQQGRAPLQLLTPHKPAKPVAVMAKPSKASRQLSGVPPLAKATITTPVSNGLGDHNTSSQITISNKNAGTPEDTQCASAGVAGERGGGGNGGQAIWRGGSMEVCMANVEGCHDQQADWKAMFEEEDLGALDSGGVTERVGEDSQGDAWEAIFESGASW